MTFHEAGGVAQVVSASVSKRTMSVQISPTVVKSRYESITEMVPLYRRVDKFQFFVRTPRLSPSYPQIIATSSASSTLGVSLGILPGVLREHGAILSATDIAAIVF